MRYRMLDANGDYVFGGGTATDFYVNQPEAVAQYVLTRLMLWQGDWFADLTQGTPWGTQVLGERTRWTRDVVLVDTVNSTPGVADIAQYNSIIDTRSRTFTAAMTIDTIYGRAQLATTRLPGSIPPLPPPPQKVQFMGITGGVSPQTQVDMVPANLLEPGQANVSEFIIRAMDAGRLS